MDDFTIKFSFVSNFVLQPIFRCVGFVGNVFCMAVLWKPSKEYQVYGYQLAIMANDISGLLAGTFWSTVSVWSSLKKNVGPLWARQNAFIMWYTAHVANLSTSIFLINVCLFLSATACDRLWGLYFSVSYHAMAMKRRSIMIYSITASFLISCLISFPDYFHQGTRYNATTGTYDVFLNEDFSNSTFSDVVLYTRQVVRFGCFLAVVTASVFIIWKYRRQTKTTIAGENRGSGSERKSKSDQVHHRTFTMLTIAQSLLLVIGQGPESVAYAMIYTGNDAWLYNTARGRFFRDMVNLLDIAPYWANILIFGAMSKGFRRLAKERLVKFGKGMMKKWKKNQTGVAPNVVNGPARQGWK